MEKDYSNHTDEQLRKDLNISTEWMDVISAGLKGLDEVLKRMPDKAVLMLKRDALRDAHDALRERKQKEEAAATQRDQEPDEYGSEIVTGMGTQMSETDYKALVGRARAWEITEDGARLYINREFGFEASRIRIINEVNAYREDGGRLKAHQKYTRAPQYFAPDSNYVRFNVGAWQYEAVNGELRRYYG